LNFIYFLNTIILLGVIQGLVTSFLLYKNNQHQYANKVLAILIFCIAIDCFNIFLYEVVDIHENSTLYNVFRSIVPLGIYMPIGPLIYFYIRALFEEGFKMDKKSKVHFITILLDFAPYILGVVFVLGILSGVMTPLRSKESHFWGNLIDTYQKYMDIPRWISMTAYIWISHKYLIQIRKVKNEKTIRWAKEFHKGFFYLSVLWFAYLIFYISPFSSGFLLDHFSYYPIYIPLVITIYWLGINGFIINPQKTISSVLNQHLNESFNEFVNYYRIEEVKLRLSNPEYDYLTITGIALDCGFNSQATFQRAFMHFVKITPKQFRSEQKNSLNTSQI